MFLTRDEEDSGSPLEVARRDLIAAGTWADVELDFFLLHLDMTCAILNRLEVRRSGGDLGIERFPFQRNAPQLGIHLSNLLGAILQNQQLLQLDLHARTLGARGVGVNRHSVIRPRTMQELIPPNPNELLRT